MENINFRDIYFYQKFFYTNNDDTEEKKLRTENDIFETELEAL